MPRNPDLPCADCGHLMWRSSTSLPKGHARCRPCRKIASSAGRAIARVRATTSWRACEICGATYRAKSLSQRTCSRACGVLINTRNARAVPSSCPIDLHPCRCCGRMLSRPGRILCGERECALEDGRRRARDAFESQARPTSLPCADCGETYTTKTATNCGVCRRCRRRRFNRDRGASDRARARAYGVQYEPISRAVVYERDGWTCGICLEPVDPALRGPNPMSASLDHVKPLSRGGDHLYSNVQCAHFLCNSLKGAREGAGALSICG